MRLTRRMAVGGVAAIAAIPASTEAVAMSRGLRVLKLRTALVENPIGIHEHNVRLSWQLHSTIRDTLQTGCRIQVASSEANLRAGIFDLWDSGQMSGARSMDVPYGGQPLKSAQRAWWHVQVWDSHGRTAQSEPAFWEMGLLSADDWRGQWIAIESQERRADREAGLFWIKGPKPEKDRSCQFRLNFNLDTDARVSLVTVAEADYEAFIDGDPVLLPPWPRHAFGRQGAVETLVSLKGGTHTLAVSIRNATTCAMMVRVEYPDGRIARVNALVARVSTDKPDGWVLPQFNDQAWGLAGRAPDLGQPLPGSGAFLVRRTFSAPTQVVRARLYVTALGAYEAYINGQRVGDDILAPESMDFRKRVRYRVHDVTALVMSGTNVVGAMVADGWYGSYTAPFGRFAFGEAPLRFLAQLDITYGDGRTETIATDTDWMISPAPITAAEIYNGEDYDARLEQPGWAKPAFAPDIRWSRVTILPPAAAVPLEGAVSPPVRRVRTLAPKSITPVNGAYVVDFGQNFAGWARIRVKGQAGQKIVLKFAEVLKADGSVDQANLRAARAADTYILRGDPNGEVYEPRFTYHGFRYVEISGTTHAPVSADIGGVVIHSDLDETGHLKIGHPLIQQFWQNSLWSQRSNFMGIPTDCPQRDERLGWMGDAHVFWNAASFNMDVGAFTQRWMADVRDAQWPNGAYAFIAPNSMRDTGRNEASPGWADAGVILPWTAWKQYGDTAVIDQNWDAMAHYIAFIEAHSDNHIWKKGHGWDFGDWLALDSRWPGDHTTPPDLIGTAMWKHSTDAMIDMAQATGRHKAAENYRALARRIVDAFVRTYVKPDGVVGNDSQTGYILALNYKLVPETLRPALQARLRDNIVRRGHLLTTGFLGTPPSLDVLADAGFDATVYDLLLRTEYPSWGYMVRKGATTTWERWNSDVGDVTMNSFNHYAFGAVIGFIYRRIAGIDPIEPGFRVFRVNPVLDPRVPEGGADYDAAPGRISTRWTWQVNGRFSLRLSVPANSTARVHLPARAMEQITEGGRPVSAARGIRFLGKDGGRIVLDAGSGDYRFSVY